MSDTPSVTGIIRSQADKALATGNVERSAMLLELALAIDERPITPKKLFVNLAA